MFLYSYILLLYLLLELLLHYHHIQYFLLSIHLVYNFLLHYLLYHLFHAYKKVLGYVLLVIGALVVWIVIDFDSFWTMFHHLFFPGNDLWLLDLRKDILIMIVPPEFFNHLVLMIVSTFLFIIISSYLLLKKISERGE